MRRGKVGLSFFFAKIENCSLICTRRKELDYKWEATSCATDTVEYICALKAPSCPAGYKWIPESGNNCFKPSIAGHYEPDTGINQGAAGRT